MPFRFIHTADIHLDSPLRSLSLRDPRIAELIGNATRQSFEKVVDLCLAEQVDAFMIAGDLYDGDLRSMKTAAFFSTQMRRLTEVGIRVFIVRGNHDAESKITKQLTLPQGVHVFSGRGEAVAIEGTDVVVHGVSFAKPSAPQSLLPKYKAPIPGKLNIGLLHTSLTGAEGHDTYAPCSLKDLREHGYDYWGLGHVHKRAVHLNEEDCTVLMPGIPQGRDINESGPRSVTLVSIEKGERALLEERFASVAQFQRLVVDAGSLETLRDYRGWIRKAITAAKEQCVSDYLVVRIEITGVSQLAWLMRRDSDVLLEEAREEAAYLKGCFVESMDFGVELPGRGEVLGKEEHETGDVPIAELHRLLREDVYPDLAFQHACREAVRELQAQLPAELRDSLGCSEEDLNEQCERLLREGGETLLANLSGMPNGSGLFGTSDQSETAASTKIGSS